MSRDKHTSRSVDGLQTSLCMSVACSLDPNKSSSSLHAMYDDWSLDGDDRTSALLYTCIVVPKTGNCHSIGNLKYFLQWGGFIVWPGHDTKKNGHLQLHLHKPGWVTQKICDEDMEA